MNFTRPFVKVTSSHHAQAGVLGLFAFLVYCMTLAPSVSFIDGGELASVAYTLGIAHPTGYPLFTLIGCIFARLPLPGEVITRLNLMAAFFSAAGIVVFYHLCRLVLEKATRLPEDRKEVLIACASGGATLLLAFSETYWSQAVAIEVYSLHTFFLSTICYTFLRAAYQGPGGNSDARWYLFAFVLGLSFANHMTTILLAPGLLYLYFALQGGKRKSWFRLFRMAPGFIAGLSVYLYLPFRSAQLPALNWGNPTSLERFLWHFSGKQYRVWIFSSTGVAGRQLNYFLTSLPGEFAFAGLILAIPGLIMLWRAQRKLAIALVLLFCSCVLYSINYDIHDIDSYFLLAYFVLALLAGIGLHTLGGYLLGNVKARPAMTGALLVTLGLVPLWYHYQRADESKNYLVQDYTMNMFASLRQNALVLSYQWDYWVSASYYYQLVMGIRPDIVVVDKELLRRSWYIKELEYRYPWLIGGSHVEAGAFMKEVYKFEHDLPYNPGIIQTRYVEMIRSFISRNMSERPVYVTAEIEPEFTRGYQKAPEGLAFRLFADTLFHPFSPPSFRIRPFDRSGRLEDLVPGLYTDAFAARAEYCRAHGQVEEAEIALKTGIAYDSTMSRTTRRFPVKIRD